MLTSLMLYFAVSCESLKPDTSLAVSLAVQL